MKLYVVTSGCYSDYGILAIFDSRERAEAFIGPSNNDENGSGSRIEVYGLNEWQEMTSRGLQHFSVGLSRNGDVLRVSAEIPGYFAIENEDGNDSGWWRPWKKQAEFVAKMWAADETAAIKIANERRILSLASLCSVHVFRHGIDGGPGICERCGTETSVCT